MLEPFLAPGADQIALCKAMTPTRADLDRALELLAALGRTLPATRMSRPGERLHVEEVKLPAGKVERRGAMFEFAFVGAPDAGKPVEHGGVFWFFKGRWVCLPPLGV